MLSRFFNLFVFQLEKFILRGAFNQLLFIAGLIVFVSLVGGTLVYFLAPGFGSFAEAVWWGFLRLSDPGYLGDDSGYVARTVSTIVTVLGYVLFMGALIAIMNQGLRRLMERLEAGVTPLRLRGHILVLGWTDRTPAIVRELFLSEGRVRRYLQRVHVDRLRVVVMAERVTSDLAYDLKVELGPVWNPSTITLRSGNLLRTEHLERANFLEAGAIILPAGDFESGGAEALDARTIKTLMSISTAAILAGRLRPPPVTTELFDPRKIAIAQAGYAGEINAIAGSTMICRLIAQNVRHPGLSHVYSELLTYGRGNEIYIREFPALAGTAFGAVGAAFPRAIPLGLMRPQKAGLVPMLCPAADLVVAAGDRLVLIAAKYEAAVPEAAPAPPPLRSGAGLPEPPVARRVLVLGWSHKLPALLSEFQSYAGEQFDVTVVSLQPTDEREKLTGRFAGNLSSVEVRHVEADYTAPLELEELNPRSYDNVVFLASDWLASGEESDARSVLGFLLLRTLLDEGGAADAADRPEVLVELIDPENERLFAERSGEVLISPMILSHMLAHVALRRDLRLIFEELFTAGGAEFFFRAPAGYVAPDRPHAFRAIQEAVAAKGEIALGIFLRNGEGGAGRLHLNPARESRWTLSAEDEIVVLTTYV